MNSTERQILEKLQRARDAYSEKQYQKAIEMYKWVEEQIQDDPANLPIIQIELGWSCYNAKDFGNCIFYLEQARNSSSIAAEQRFDCLRLIGFSYQVLGETEKALEFMEKALRQDIAEPDKKYVYFEVGKIHFLRGAIKKSKIPLKKSSEFFDWQEGAYYRTALYYLGFIAFYEKQFAKAKEFFSEIIENSSDNKGRAAGYFGLAHLLYQNKSYRELVDVCKRISELDRNFYDKETLGFFLSKSYLELQQYDEFTIFYDELRHKYPAGRYQTYYWIFEKKRLQLKSER